MIQNTSRQETDYDQRWWPAPHPCRQGEVQAPQGASEAPRAELGGVGEEAETERRPEAVISLSSPNVSGPIADAHVGRAVPFPMENLPVWTAPSRLTYTWQLHVPVQSVCGPVPPQRPRHGCLPGV